MSKTWSTKDYSLTYIPTILVSFTSDFQYTLEVLTGYEPHTYLTLPKLSKVLDIASQRNRLTNLSKLPTPITQSWVFTIPIPFWITRAFHIEEGLSITFQISISLHHIGEEFNSFTIGIVFRRRTEKSLPPSFIEESRITFGYLWPNLYHQIEEDLIVCTPSRGSAVTGVTTLGTTTPVDPLTLLRNSTKFLYHLILSLR